VRRSHLRRASLALALLGVALVGGCGRPATRVLLLGDSITAGTVSEPTGPAYPEQLETALGSDFELVRAACGGTTTRDWLPQASTRSCDRNVVQTGLYHDLVLPLLPVDVSVVLLGSNDAQGFREREPISVEEYGANLSAIARALLRDGSDRVVLMTAPPIYHRIKHYRRLMSLRAQVEQLCASEPRVECGPNLFDLLAPDDFEPSNLHPNATGHARIAEALAGTLRALGPDES
jgi:lysophospholipase L1-like esterase